MNRVSASAADTRIEQRETDSTKRGTRSRAPIHTFHDHHRSPRRADPTGPRTYYRMHRKAGARPAEAAPLWTLHSQAPARLAAARPALPVLPGRLAQKARAALQWVRTATFKATGRRFFFSVAPSHPLHEFKHAARKLKRRRKAASTMPAAAEIARAGRPVAAMPMNLAELWAWYRATGKSYAQFRRDYGIN